VWWPTLRTLRCVDMLAGDILTLTPSGTMKRTPTGSKVAAAVRPRWGGGGVVAIERGFALARREDLTDLVALPPAFGSSEIRMNDGACDPDGRFYCGTMAYDKAQGAAAMYRLGSPLAASEQVLGDLTISNGLGWSPDGSTAYYIDTPTRRVDVFDYSREGGLAERRPLVQFEEDDGWPDGLCVDAEGGIWVAMNGAGRVRRYDVGGQLTEVVSLSAGDVTQTTACTLGGPDMSTLYITTSREGLAHGVQKRAGSVFSVEVGVAGLPPLPYRW
jgi:sugar lactone lactonase YvrE